MRICPAVEYASNRYCLIANVVVSSVLLIMYCDTKRLLEECKARHSKNIKHATAKLVPSISGHKQFIKHDACTRFADYLKKDTTFYKSYLEAKGSGTYLTCNVHEITRRTAIRGITELWHFLNWQLKSIGSMKISKPVRTKLKLISSSVAQQKSIMLRSLQILKKMDGLDKWRRKEEIELGSIIQSRLKYIQNPDNCTSAKKILCTTVPRGYACQMHHFILCLLTAYATNRTLVLDFRKWLYKENLETFYESLSTTCKYTQTMVQNAVKWPGKPTDAVIHMPFILQLATLPPFIFPAIPRDLSDRLVQLTEEPSVWWTGQLFKYMLRPTNTLVHLIDELTRNIGFIYPIVGIQIRRTDKLRVEATYQNLSKYMEYVAEFYDHLKITKPNVIQRVYLATDDPTLLSEAKRRYPSYNFLTSNSSIIAENLKTRYTPEGLRGIILDIHLLSRCNFLVCTFSSNICRMAYAIMTTVDPDAWLNYRSIDNAYTFASRAPRYQVVTQSYPNSYPGEIEVKPGDKIKLFRNHVKGFTYGMNLRTQKTGRFPSFMAMETTPTAEMPSYPEVASHLDVLQSRT